MSSRTARATQRKPCLEKNKTNSTSLKQNKTQTKRWWGHVWVCGLFAYMKKIRSYPPSTSRFKFCAQLKYSIKGMNTRSAFVPPGPLLHGLLIHRYKSILAPSLHIQPLSKPKPCSGGITKVKGLPKTLNFYKEIKSQNSKRKASNWLPSVRKCALTERGPKKRPSP